MKLAGSIYVEPFYKSKQRNPGAEKIMQHQSTFNAIRSFLNLYLYKHFSRMVNITGRIYELDVSTIDFK